MDWLESCKDALSDVMRRHQRVALLYSGGAESSLHLHLAAPRRDKITVYTVRTGAEFPHMIEFIDRKLKDFDHRVVKVDLMASFLELGIPASVVPIEHVDAAAHGMNIDVRLPRIAAWPLCCHRNRWAPGCDAIKADGISAVIHGQRNGDWPKNNPAPLEYEGLELVAPLANVSRTEVMAAVNALGIDLPSHYSEYQSSLDCAVCPSSLTTPRRVWMAQRYPEVLKVAEGLHLEVTKAALAAFDGDNTRNAFTVT